MNQCFIVNMIAVLIVSLNVGSAWSQIPEPLPFALIAAWERAGAVHGWMRDDPASFRHDDTGVRAELACLKQLRTLNLRNTSVTDAGIATLRKTLPKLHVER